MESARMFALFAVALNVTDQCQAGLCVLRNIYSYNKTN